MKARFQLNDPEKMEASMTITMTVQAWIELRDQLQKAWPSSELSSAVSDIILQARKCFWTESD